MKNHLEIFKEQIELSVRHLFYTLADLKSHDHCIFKLGELMTALYLYEMLNCGALDDDTKLKFYLTKLKKIARVMGIPEKLYDYETFKENCRLPKQNLQSKLNGEISLAE